MLVQCLTGARDIQLRSLYASLTFYSINQLETNKNLKKQQAFLPMVVFKNGNQKISLLFIVY